MSTTSDDDALADARAKIDELDQRIHALINERAGVALKVADIKQAAGRTDFYRPEREAQVLERVAARNEGPLADAAVARIMREIMSACLALEKPMTVAYLGPEGTYTQAAVYKHFGHAVIASPKPAIGDIFRDVEAGNAHFGVVPVENSTEGRGHAHPRSIGRQSVVDLRRGGAGGASSFVVACQRTRRDQAGGRPCPVAGPMPELARHSSAGRCTRSGGLERGGGATRGWGPDSGGNRSTGGQRLL